MNVVLWILQGVLAFAMVGAGAMKAGQSREKLLEDPRMGWVGDFSDSTVRAIGVLELLAGIGLILPWWLDIAPVLTPLAALGVVAIQIGAIITHRRRDETQTLAMNAVLLLVAFVVAIGRFADL